MSQFPYQNQPQPAWIDGTTAETQERVRSFVRSVYGWMFGGLLLTALSATWVITSASMKQLVLGNPIVVFGLMFAELGIVAFLSFRITRMSPAAAAAAFLSYALLNGLTLSVIFYVYTAASIVQAFVVAGGMFGAMALYGLVTKRDLTSWGSFFMMGLFGVLLCMLLSFFWHSAAPALTFVFSVVGVFVFMGLTAYDNQKIKMMATAAGPTENFAVYGALRLYLDFINLFLFLLRLFGGSNRR